jgi:hypothetical protein
MVVVNQNTDPKRHGVCGNDGLIIFQPEQLRDQFMAEHAALVAVAEAARDVLDAYHGLTLGRQDTEWEGGLKNKLRKAYSTLAAVRAGSEVAK